ncbi:MAG: tRNA lysidine(34) synthetase TilS [Acidobacteria bacterium]|nr:MAG: tRNA lysidine(34) synthetase TilS [Acidobacteriota bacterium]
MMLFMKTRLLKQFVYRLKTRPYATAKGFWLAVSGGVDSMVMLDAMRRLRHVHGKKMNVLYVHHQTADFADLSEKVVAGYCQKYGIYLTTEHFNESHENFEFSAAEFRRNCLLELASPQEKILLGHHQRDFAETLMLSMLRGTGLHGNSGLQAENGPFLRPMLHVNRELIYEHARMADVPHVLDPTNRDQKQFRGSLRGLFNSDAFQYYNGGESALYDWHSSYSTLKHQLQKTATERCSQFKGTFPIGLFKRDELYLWPFLLNCFLESAGLKSAGKRQRARIIQMIENKGYGYIDIGGKRAWVDLDGLACVDVAPLPERTLSSGHQCVWGSWLFERIEGERLFDFSNEPITLRVPERLDKRVREFFRKHMVPHRFRKALPTFIQGNKERHIVSIMQKPQNAIVWRRLDRNQWNRIQLVTREDINSFVTMLS